MYDCYVHKGPYVVYLPLLLYCAALIGCPDPGGHDALARCWANAGPAS